MCVCHGSSAWLRVSLAKILPTGSCGSLRIMTVHCEKHAKMNFNCRREDCRHNDTQQNTTKQTVCLLAKVINPAIYTIEQIRHSNLKGSVVCERTGGGSSGLPDHVRFGSGRATSVQQAYDLSTVHAPFCCSHGSSQAVGCMLSVPFFGWYSHMTSGIWVGLVQGRWFSLDIWPTQRPSCLLFPRGIQHLSWISPFSASMDYFSAVKGVSD